MGEYAKQPVSPYRLTMDVAAGTISPQGPTLVRRLSDLEGLFRDCGAWRSDRSRHRMHASSLSRRSV